MHALTCVLQLRVLNFLLSHPHKCWSVVNFENVELHVHVHNFTSYYTVLKLVHICNHENCESREAPAVNRGQFNKTFMSVAIVLGSENNSYTCTLHL